MRIVVLAANTDSRQLRRVYRSSLLLETGQNNGVLDIPFLSVLAVYLPTSVLHHTLLVAVDLGIRIVSTNTWAWRTPAHGLASMGTRFPSK